MSLAVYAVRSTTLGWNHKHAAGLALLHHDLVALDGHDPVVVGVPLSTKYAATGTAATRRMNPTPGT